MIKFENGEYKVTFTGEVSLSAKTLSNMLNLAYQQGQVNEHVSIRMEDKTSNKVEGI